MERNRVVLFLLPLIVVPLLVLDGCGGGSGDVSWRLETNFGLTEGTYDGRTKAASGAAVEVRLRTEDPGQWAWTLSFCDDEHFRPLDHWTAGEAAVWVFEAAAPGETWLSFSTVPRDEGGPHPGRGFSALFEIR